MSEALREAAEKALEMLGHCTPDKRYGDDYLEREFAELNAVRKALRAALAKPEQSEPYIYYDPDTGETWTVGAIEDGCRSVDGLIALYAAPPSQTPVPPRLTDGELSDLLPEPDGTAEENVTKVQVLPGVWGTEFEEGPAWSEPVVKDFARAIESAVRKQFGVNDE